MKKYRYLNFFVPGPCVPQSRPKAHRVGNGVVMHDVPKCVSYKMDVAACAYKAMQANHIEGPVIPSGRGFTVSIYIYKAYLKSMTKKQREDAGVGILLPLAKPDLDNSAKGILDALTGVFWRDDSAVTSLRVQKSYTAMDYVDVQIEWEEEVEDEQKK